MAVNELRVEDAGLAVQNQVRRLQASNRSVPYVVDASLVVRRVRTIVPVDHVEDQRRRDE